MDIFDLIRKQTTQKNLNASEANEQLKILDECRNNGFIPNGTYNLKRKELRDVVNFNFDTKTDVETIQVRHPQTEILADCKWFFNVQSNIKVPYMTADGVQWGYTDPTEATKHISHITLKPHQLGTYLDISTTINVLDHHLAEDVANVLNNAVKDRLVETIFSDTDISGDTTPKGLFAYKSEESAITEISEDNIYNAILNVETKKHNGKWILSPSALVYLMKNHKDLFADALFDNGKLAGFDFIVDGRVQDGFMTFIDLSRVGVGDWTINSITIDDITRKVDGEIRINAISYLDFAPFTTEAYEVLIVPTDGEDDDEEIEENQGE